MKYVVQIFYNGSRSDYTLHGLFDSYERAEAWAIDDKKKIRKGALSFEILACFEVSS